jgi:hypothetical protein
MEPHPADHPYSSYSAYASGKEDDLVTRELIRSMLHPGDIPESILRYRQFVESAIGSEMVNPLKDVYGGAILGGRRFIKDALWRGCRRPHWSMKTSLKRTAHQGDGYDHHCGNAH